MNHFKAAACAAALGSASGIVLALAALAGGDKVVFPEDYAKGVLYGTVDRHDNKQYRELWGSAVAVDAARKGQPIPSGTVLTLVQYKAQLDDAGNTKLDPQGRFIKGDLIAYTVMEKRTGWGTEYKDDIRNGEWEYQSFGPDKKVNEKANLTACFTCHKPHAGQDFVISLASLKGTPPGTTAPPQASPGYPVVSIANFKFGPETLAAAPNTPITWHNADGSPHQVTITGAKPQRSAVILKGQTAQLIIAEPGYVRLYLRPAPGHEGQDRNQVSSRSLARQPAASMAAGFVLALTQPWNTRDRAGVAGGPPDICAGRKPFVKPLAKQLPFRPGIRLASTHRRRGHHGIGTSRILSRANGICGIRVAGIGFRRIRATGQE